MNIVSMLMAIPDKTIRYRAIQNISGCNYGVNAVPGCVSLGRAIKMAFTWSYTIEGHDYWENISEMYDDYYISQLELGI